MIVDTKQIILLLDELSSVIKGHVDLYMIGGGAMMFLGSKQFTKDLDLVACNENDYRDVSEALSSIGFTSDMPTCGMDKVDLQDTLTRGEYRIDLFDRVICGSLLLSETMKARSVSRYESGSINLYSCGAEDIFLLKSVTEREGDIADCNSLIRSSTKFDWNALISEIRGQMAVGNPVWITYVMERLDIMDFKSRRSDVYNLVKELEGNYLEEWADRYENSHEL